MSRREGSFRKRNCIRVRPDDDLELTRGRALGCYLPDISEFPCEWFALCVRPAAGVVAHPVLGKVPTCAVCAASLDLELEALL